MGNLDWRVRVSLGAILLIAAGALYLSVPGETVRTLSVALGFAGGMLAAWGRMPRGGSTRPIDTEESRGPAAFPWVGATLATLFLGGAFFLLNPRLFPFDQRILVYGFAATGFATPAYLFYRFFVKGRS